MLLEALLSQDLKSFRKAQTWLINTVRKILFKLKSISGFLVFLVLFNLQSAFRPGHQAAFSARSLECLYIISNPSPFVNTFFHFFCVFFQVLPSVFDIAGFQGDPSLFHYILLINSSGWARRCSGGEKKAASFRLRPV